MVIKGPILYQGIARMIWVGIPKMAIGKWIKYSGRPRRLSYSKCISKIDVDKYPGN